MKSDRQTMIVDIIKVKLISTQEELGEILENEGIKVTQATLSRDIKELGLVKIPALDGSYYYALPQDRAPGDLMRRAQRMVGDEVVSVEAAENIIVVKTTSGTAQAVAAAFDDLDWPEVVGTVAGDNTIFAVVRTKELTVEIMKRIRQLRG